MRKIWAAVMASAVTLAVAAPSIAEAQMRRLPGEGGSFQVGQSRFGGGDGGFRPQGAGAFRQGGGEFRRNGGAFRQGGQRFGRGGYGGGYRHRGGYGAAVGAGVAGLAAGALIGGALANQNGYYEGGGYYGNGYGYGGYDAPVVTTEEVAPVASSDETVAYCQQRFKSYDVSSGTYLGYDGERHPCP